ncbi:MAG: SIS domain-containing protein [Proteobacteria bacterium]|nr:SIS domain-containing protein [Pseudomonadota bacterium]
MQARMPTESFSAYSARLQNVLAAADWSHVALLADDMLKCWQAKSQVFLCGNGGSAGNAIHLANDFLYGIAKSHGGGMRVLALSANSAVMTCLGNDLGYEHIFSEQLAVQGQPGDLLIALSGSGNSPNIVRVIGQAKTMGVKSYAVLGYSGGKCKDLADIAIHFPVNDMQIAEDLQLIVGHMLMQWLYSNRPQPH